jgi:hypothetical protein
MESPFDLSGAVVKLARLIFPSGDIAEFCTLESALRYINSARAANVIGADEVMVLSFENGEWMRIVER